MDHIPILKMDNILLVSIQVEMHDRLALTLQKNLMTSIVETGARGVLLDITAVETVDSFIGRVIANTASMTRILNAETLLVGMRPEVAITLVELGVSASLKGIRTALNVDKGLQTLRTLLATSDIENSRYGETG